MAGVRKKALSVALCTFDGAQHLPEQLKSILVQTRLPDEVVVCDDGSRDATLAIVREFAATAPFDVHVHETTGERLGPARNFDRALRLTTGDVVALCDQDDVWHTNRLATTEQALAAQADADAFFSDADLVDEWGVPVGETLWEALGIVGRTQRSFEEGSRRARVRLLGDGNIVTGATLAVRARVLDRLLPVPDGWLHDYWFAVVLAASAEMIVHDEPLCHYRIHPGQHTGLGTRRQTRWYFVRRRTQLTRRLHKNERQALGATAAGLDALTERLVEIPEVDPRILKDLRSRRTHFAARARFADGGRRPRLVARELVAGRYHRHSSGLSSAAKDLFLTDVRP